MSELFIISNNILQVPADYAEAVAAARWAAYYGYDCSSFSAEHIVNCVDKNCVCMLSKKQIADVPLIEALGKDPAADMHDLELQKKVSK